MGRIIGEHILIVYNEWHVKSVAEMVFEHYNTPEYDNTAFIIDEWFDIDIDPKYSRIIFYNLEHYEYTWVDYELKDGYLPPNTTEVWDFEINNLKYYEEAGVTLPVKFMPLRFTTRITNDAPKPKEPKFDLGFVGLFSKLYHYHRVKLLEDLSDMFSSPNLRSSTWGLSVNIMWGKSIHDLLPELNNCKFVLDCQSQKPEGYIAQNQVRIFEHIIYGHHVISEDNEGINYFPGMISQFIFPRVNERKPDPLITYGGFLIDEMKKTPQNFSQQYKDMTYTDEAYELYRQNLINEYNIKFSKNDARDNQ